jgi:TonB family protein
MIQKCCIGLLLTIFAGMILACSPRQHVRSELTPPVQAATEPTKVPTGRVIVKICIAEKGDVISSSVIPEKSTTIDTILTQKALRAAQAYKFAPAPGKGVQCGTLTFDFKTKQ